MLNQSSVVFDIPLAYDIQFPADAGIKQIVLKREDKTTHYGRILACLKFEGAAELILYQSAEPCLQDRKRFICPGYGKDAASDALMFVIL